MARQPTGLGFVGDVTDDDLEAAIDAEFSDQPEATSADIEPTDAPDPAPSGPSETDDNPETPETDTAPEATTPDPAPAAHPVPETASQPAATDAGTPFQFKASGGDHTLPWATERADGSVVIPKEHANEFRRLASSQRELHTNFTRAKAQFDRDLKAARTERTEKDAEADAISSMMGELLRMTPEQQFEYLTTLQGNIPKLQLDLERKQIDAEKRLLEERQRGPQLSPEEQREQLTQTATSMLDQEWTDVAAIPEFAGLTEADRKRVFDRWRGRATHLLRQVTDQREAEALQVPMGSVVFDATELRKDLLDVVEFRKANAPQAPAQPSKAAQVNAQRNADLQQQRKPNAIPPSVRSQAPTGQARDSEGKFKKAKPGSREYREYVMSGEDEDE